MKLITTSLLVAATQAGFQTTGETPNQNAEVYLVVDTSMTNNMADYFARMTSLQMKRLTAVYEAAGYTITGGVAKTGRADKTCWKQVAPVGSSLTEVATKIDQDYFSADPDAKDRYNWYAVMHAGRYEMDLSDDIRRVVMLLTDQYMPWGSEIALDDISNLKCGKAAPPSSQFLRYVRDARAGLLFASQHSYKSNAETLQKQVIDYFEELNLTDVAVSKAWMWPKSGASSASFYDATDYLEAMLSPSWIATTSTTLAPEDKLRKCIAEAFECA